MKTISIIGTGAIGGYCAVKLQQAGFDVSCLCGSDYETIKKNGLTLIENDGSEIIAHVKTFSRIQQLSPADFVLVALKTTANSILKDSLNSLIKQNGAVVLLQNGIGMESEIAEYIEPEKIIGGICYIKVTKIAPGVIRHFGFNNVELAQYYANEHEEGISSNVEELSIILQKAGLEAKPAPHLPSIRWKKLGGNIATSGLCIALNASHNELVENPDSFVLLKKITQEAVTAATKSGAQLPDDFFKFRLKVFESFKTMEKHNSSMKDDFDANKPIELDAIYKNALSIAAKHGVKMPYTEMLYHQLLFMVAKKQEAIFSSSNVRQIF